MFLSAYVTKYFRDDTTLMTLCGQQIFHRKCPQPTAPIYIVVGTDQDYDHGNITVKSLTYKQSSFTMLIVAEKVALLQAPWKRLVAQIETCRYKTVNSEELGGSMFIQCLQPEDGEGQLCDGLNLEGNELSRPCIMMTLRGSFTVPTLS